MENNILNISEGYKAVLLPKDAEKIDMPIKDQIWFQVGVNIYWINLPFNGELIGLLNEISEYQATEIVNYNALDAYFKGSALEVLISRIEGLGIQTENPLKKPRQMTLIDGNGHKVSNLNYDQELSAWEASERDIKRILIIKCKEE